MKRRIADDIDEPVRLEPPSVHPAPHPALVVLLGAVSPRLSRRLLEQHERDTECWGCGESGPQDSGLVLEVVGPRGLARVWQCARCVAWLAVEALEARAGGGP